MQGLVGLERYDRDRLMAIKDVLADAFVEPFDIRDARQCAYRVMTDILARDQITADKPSLPKVDDVETARRHFEHIDRLERTYRALLRRQPGEAADGSSVATVDLDALAKAIGDDTGELAIIKFARLSPGGYSKATVFAELMVAGETTPIVVRADVSAGVSGTSVLDEYPVLRALHAAGVAVPKPIWAGTPAGSPGAVMVVESVEGIAFGSPISSILQDDHLCAALGTQLARLHQVAPSTVAGILAPTTTHDQILSAIDISLKMLEGTGASSPLHLYAFRWLRENIGCVRPSSAIVHGDFGPHNLLTANSEVTAILDWELVKLGHPAEDLCWSRLAIEALGSWDIFLDAYESSGGTRPSEDELCYFTVLSLARVSVMQLQIDLSFGTGQATLVRWAGPGVERLRPTMLRLGAMLGFAPGESGQI